MAHRAHVLRLAVVLLAFQAHAQHTGPGVKGGAKGVKGGSPGGKGAWWKDAEKWCEVPPSPDAASTSCLKRGGRMSCTATCMTGFRFPDGRDEMTLQCDRQTGLWQPLQQFPNCEGVCFPPCLNGGRCYGNNHCVCSKRFRGDHCQYPIDLCDGHILNYGGSWHCNHTQQETLCEVTCPPGFVYPHPNPMTYRCSIEGVWNPPIVAGCIPSGGSFLPGNELPPNGHFEQKPIDVEGETTGPGPRPPSDNQIEQEVIEPHKETDENKGGPDVPAEGIPPVKEPAVKSSGVCTTWGQFQFKSFDGTLYRFAGACSYVLLKDCQHDEAFSINLEHSQGCPKSPDCTRTLHIVSGIERVSIPLTKGAVRDLSTMVSHMPSLIAQEAGMYLVLQSPHGFTLWLDEESVQLRVTPALRASACGLCGHYDGEPSNDLVPMGGNGALSARDFAISWSLERDCFHGGHERDACAIQSSKDKDVFQKAFDSCSMVFNDVYKDCHQVLKPHPFFEACKQDCCDKESPSGCECATLEEYFRECQRLGVHVKSSWRENTVCQATCVNGTEWRECGPACRATCSDPEPACSVNQCVCGCHCPEGTLWQGDRCVAPSECGCSYRGRDYKSGDRVDEDCNTCICDHGNWRCTEAICDASCSVLLGGIFTTFDGHRFQIQGGHCSFTLLQAQGLTVALDRSSCSLLAQDAVCLGDVILKIGDSLAVKVNQELQVSVNGREVHSLPAVFPKVTITRPTSFYVEVELEGLTLLTDGKTRLVMKANEALYTNTMGLCGTFNHNIQDEFLCPGGDVDQQVESFVRQWANAECTDVRPATQQCDEDQPHWRESKKLCRQLYLNSFAGCHEAVHPEQFFELCIQAACSCASDARDCICPVLSHYAHACAQRGHVLDWRNDVPQCGVSCENGQSYQSCASVCDSSCSLIGRNVSCASRCVEGCACGPGQSTDSRGHCVPVSECGCLFRGYEYPAGFKQRRHAEHCECSGGKWHCRPANTDDVIFLPSAESCAANEEYSECLSTCPRTCSTLNKQDGPECAVDVCQAGCQCREGYVRNEQSGECVLPSTCPCRHGSKSYAEGETITVECNKCICASGHWSCTQQQCAGTCALWGDSHVTTFDGAALDFSGVCDYVLVKGGLPNNQSISVVVQNVPCGRRASCAKAVTITAGTEVLVLTEGHPVPPLEPDSRMQVHTLGLFVGVDVFGGLAVFWDKHARVYVVAGPAWSNKLQGLCGNFNGDGTDDFRAPSGGPTLPDAIEFVDSWKLHPHCAPAVAQQDGCLAQPDRKKWAASQCQILREDLFRPCHSEVDVQPFYDRCVSDTCACDTGGDCECLCTAIGAYAHQCASRGVRVLWRSQELCPLQCDTCDEYSACVSFCKPPTCEYPVVHDACKVSPPLCLEGCTPALCPNGMVHRTATDRTCVPVQDCGVPPETGCSIGGLHFKEGQRVATSNACQSCFCVRGEVRCVGKPCPIEVKTCVQTGWSDWESMNAPEYQGGNDFESLQAHGDHCPVEHMVAVECRTVGSKTPWNETGESVLCSPHTGLRCLREDQDDRELCSNYEMRVFCRCLEEESRGGDECPPGSHWSECGIRCNATCGPFLHKLQSEGFCASEESGCVPSCVSSDCQPDEFHFDKDTCVPVQHCPCLLPERETPLAPGEVFEKECEKCQCAHNEVSCLHLEGCGTEAPQETTTYTPEPEGGCWTPWFSSDTPEGPGDFEDLRPLQAHGKVCSQPAAINCRTVAGHTDWTQSGQKVTCSVDGGLQCWNSGNSPEQCQDYEVRFYCPCEETPTPVPWTPVPEPHCEHGWSSWLNGHSLDAQGDLETLQSARDAGLLQCPSVTAMECREADSQVSWDQSGLVGVQCDLTTGLVCRNKGQPKGRSCADFEVRFFCDCGGETPPPPPTLPPATPTPAILVETTPPACSFWSDWVDNNHPGLEGQDGEREPGLNLRPELGDFCQEGSVTEAECAESSSGTPYEEARQAALHCDVNDGYSCRDQDQPTGRCTDIKIRFFCSCEEVAPTTVVIVTPKPTPHPGCSEFIRLIDGPEPLKDSLLKASSSQDSKSGPQASRFSSHGSWVPHLNDKEFIEAELVRPQTVYGVETRGDSQLGAWVTSFTVMFSQDGVAYGQLSNTDGSPKVFSGNHDAQSKNRQLFEHPFQAKFIRLVPKSWEGRIALKWDLLGCSYETFTPKPIGTPSNMEVCREPMGLQSGLIGDNQMEASSYRDEEHAAHYGRVEQRGWVAGVADKQQYLQVDFEDSRNLTAVVTQGRPEIPQWVKSFIVQTSNNGKRWNTIKDKEGEEMVFSGNFDSSTPVTSVFPKTVSARYIRVVPVTWKNWIALRLEVLGCEHEEWTTTPGPTTPGPTTAAPIVVPGFKCPEPNGLFPDPINCRMFYHCSNDQPHHKWCPGDLHFNPKLLVCDWKQNAGCEEGFISEQPKTTPEPVVTQPPEPCVAYGPWVSTTDPGLESEGDVEDIGRIIEESGMCREPMGIECREYATDADYRSTGQKVTCDLEHGLRCLNHEQDSRPCLNYKVRVKCWTCGALEVSTVTPELTTVHCPEVSGENATACGEGCPVGFACDGVRCVHEADCPCVRDGKHFPVGGILETRTCQECQCQLGGRSNCLPIACPACHEGRPKILNPDCSCDCGGCREGQRLCPTSGECINEELWCDGVVNCPDDEAQCEAKTPAPCPPVAKVFCGKGQTMTLQTDDQGCEHFTCESGERPIIVPPPPTKASCELVGHHFSTFDGREFDYSYCHHILLQDVVGGNLTISVDRHCSLENQESCPKRVIVEHGHHRIVLDADLSATVDGDEYSAHQLQLLTKRLPDFELERVGERIHFRSRVHSLVLKLDVRGRVEIEVDSSLKGVLGGLCGFYNELVSDDLTTPAGHQVATTDEFGDSWATPGTAQDCLPLACPKDTLLQAAKICNRLKEEPLSQCQGIEDQLANCLSASCECLQRGNSTAESCACDAYLDAVTQCEKDGGEKAVESLRGWRLEYGCVPDCPPEMEWLDCGPDCQITCENFLVGDLRCATKKSCNPGCFCPPGTVLDRDHCKKADECADKVCTGYGDPMIETFDGWKFHLQSNGHFELVFDREGRFMVDAVTDQCEERATCIIGLDIKHENHVAKIRRHKQVLIDNEEYDRDQLPWTGMGVTIFAMPGKVTVVVFTGLGVQIRYNEISAAFSIHVPSKTFFNKTAGLCGNCNGKPDDDKTTKNGTVTEEMVTFVCSWETHISEEECVRNFTGEEPEKPPVPGACSEILDREVFGQCLSLVDTTKFVDQCRHDTSFSVQENTAVCSSLLEMARACCLADVEVDNSWIQKFCNITCPGDTRYMSCHDACPQSCDAERENEASSNFVKGSSKTHYHKSDCRNLKVDGCFCPEGQVFEDGECKPKDVCDLCDDQGHKLGDVWKTDQCTSCTCKKDGKMDCQHEVCPPDPICRENQKMVRVSGAELEQCCDKNYCQDIVEECPELSLPKCERGDVTRTKTDSKGCPMYYCECDPALCPPVVWPTDLEPGQEVEMTPVGCCATLHAVCRPEKCPHPPQCAPPLELLETPGVCCKSFKCRPPEKACPYAHKFVVVDGKEVAIEPALQNVSFYEPGQTWRDGLCSNCSCDESGSDLMARCNLERCYESAELPDDKDYFLSIVDVPDRCCPALVRLFCKDEYGNIREPGDEWQSRDDQCKSHICEQTALGEVHKVERSIICPKCPENGQALPLGPGECCPRCQIVACEEAGVMHPVGSHWNSSSHLCYRAECVQAGDTARIVYTSPSCAPVSKKCPKDQVVWDANRCCQTCNVTIVSEEACAPLPLTDRETVRMFRFEHERWGLCTNPRPVTGARECAGTCESHSLYTMGNSNDVTANCKCCNPTQWELRKIQLTCRNGKTLTKTFRQPTACQCTPCANEVGQREVEIMKEENNGGVKVPFSKQNTKYTTLQGDQPPEDRNEKLEPISQVVEEPYTHVEVTNKPGNQEQISQVVQEPYNPNEVNEKPVQPEPISQVVQEPYNPEEASDKPNKPEPISQTVQQPYNPEEVTEKPGKHEPISQIVQEPYNPEEITEKPGKPELISQTVQEPYNPEEVTDKPSKPEPISQIAQEPYNPEEVTDKPGKPEPISQIVQEPYNPEGITEKPGKPEPISQIVQEPYNPEDVTEKPGKPEPISQIVQELYNPEEVTEKPDKPEAISQIVQEPYNPEEVTDKPGKPVPISQIVQEPYNPEEVTEKPGKPEPISQIVQEPYNPEDVTEKPGEPEPISQIVQEPYNPEDVTEKPAKPEPISQIVQEPYNPEEVTEKPGKPEAIRQIVQEPYNPEEVTDKPGKPVPISQIVQEPYNPEDVTEKPGKPEPISQIVQERYNPEEVTEKPGKPEPISQIVQEPYNPEEVTEKPGNPEPISQIVQEPSNPEDVTDKPAKPEPISQIVQEPYNPEEVTEKPGKPEAISQIVQEPYNPEEVTDKPGKPEPISQIVQEPDNPEEVTEKPGKPEPISQIVQEPYNPEEVTEKPGKPEPISQIVQEPYNPEDVTEKPGKPEPISQIVQEPYNPEEVTEKPGKPEPISQIVQEPYNPEDVTEKPGKPEPISQIVQEPYNPEDVTEKPGKPEPISQIVQEPYNPEEVTEKPGKPEPISQIVQEPYNPEDVTEKPGKPEPISQIVQERYNPEEVTEKPGKPEPISQIVQEPYNPEEVTEKPGNPEPISQIVQEPSNPEDVTDKPAKPEPISQIVQEPYNPEEVTEKPGKPEAISQIVQEPYNPEEVTDKPGKPEPISQIVQEPYNPEEVTEKPGKPEPISQIVQEPYNPEDVTEKPGKPEPISQIVQEPYNPEEVAVKPNKPEPISQIVQEPYNPEEVTEKPSKPEPISQIVQEPYYPEETGSPGKLEPISHVIQEPYRPDDVESPVNHIVQEPYTPEAMEQQPYHPDTIGQVPYQPEEIPHAEIQGPLSHIVQEPYHPDDITEPHVEQRPYEPEHLGQYPYRPEDVPDREPQRPAGQVVQEPYHPEDIPEPHVEQRPYHPEHTGQYPYRPEDIVQAPYRPEDVEHSLHESSHTDDDTFVPEWMWRNAPLP